MSSDLADVETKMMHMNVPNSRPIIVPCPYKKAIKAWNDNGPFGNFIQWRVRRLYSDEAGV